MRIVNALSIKHKIIAIILSISASVAVTVLALMGILQLIGKLQPFTASTAWQLLILITLLAASFSIAVLLGSYLQRSISGPILELRDMIRTVSDTKNYSIRIPRRSNDELAALVDGFNDMLGHLEQRDRELAHQNSQVDEQVAIRTRILQEAKTKAEAMNRVKARLLAKVSHDIRTPMNAACDMAELALATELSTEQRYYVEAISHFTDSSRVIVDNILDYLNMETGKLNLDSRPFQLRDLIDDLGRLFASQAHHKILELVCDLPTIMPENVVGDAGRLRQVLFNLIGNAIKYTDKGEIVVRVEIVEESATDVLLRFQVKDTGIGIQPEHQARIFESFSWSDAPDHRTDNGTGLAVAMSQYLVERMDGQMGLKSEPGKGSVFWFCLSLAKAAPSGLTPTLPKDLHGVRILAVDDNASNRELLERYLTGFGAETTSATNGQDALRLLRAAEAKKRPYALALIDHHMPGLNGLALAYAVTSDSVAPTTCIMMLSSLDGADAVHTCRSVGVHYHLIKPLRQKALLETLLAAIHADGAALQSDTTEISAAMTTTDKITTEGPKDKQTCDPNTLAELRKMGADKDFFKRLVTTYLAKSDRELGALRDALAEDDSEKVFQITHSLKSSSNNLGAFPLASLCAKLEQAARRRDLGHASEMFTAIEQEYQQVHSLLRQELSNQQPSSPEPSSQKPESVVRV